MTLARLVFSGFLKIKSPIRLRKPFSQSSPAIFFSFHELGIFLFFIFAYS